MLTEEEAFFGHFVKDLMNGGRLSECAQGEYRQKRDDN